MDDDRFIVYTVIVRDGIDIVPRLSDITGDIDEVYGSYGETTYEEAVGIAADLKLFAQGL